MPAVIFDLDDTLYPYIQHVHSGFAAVATYVDRNCDVPAKDAYATLRFARESGKRGTRVPVALPGASPRHGHRSRSRSRVPGAWPAALADHGASEALSAFRAAGWRTALLTNGDSTVQAGKVRALGLEALVDHVVYASEHAPGGKPAREPFLEVLRRLQTAPDRSRDGWRRSGERRGWRAWRRNPNHLPRSGRAPASRGRRRGRAPAERRAACCGCARRSRDGLCCVT